MHFVHCGAFSTAGSPDRKELDQVVRVTGATPEPQRRNAGRRFCEITLSGVFLVLGHGRRGCCVRGDTASDSQWLARQVTGAFPWASAPAYLVRYNDSAYESSQQSETTSTHHKLHWADEQTVLRTCLTLSETRMKPTRAPATDAVSGSCRGEAPIEVLMKHHQGRCCA